MRFDNILYNFISPVTGRIMCTPDYVLLGNKQGVATPSPVLIDLRLDIIDIRKSFDKLTDVSFITQSPSNLLPNAQALNVLADGFMLNKGGVINTIASISADKITLSVGKLLRGAASGKAVETQTISFDNLPNLTKNHGIKGDDNDRPVEFEFNFALNDAFYILKQTDDSLSNAQALNQLTGNLPRMLKAALDGTIEVAIPDVDYATSEQLEQIKHDTEQYKNQAANSATAASNSAVDAANSATAAALASGEATAAAAEATGAAAAASGSAAAAALSALGAVASAASASSSDSSASSSADDAADSAGDAAGSAAAALAALNAFLTTNIKLAGDISGEGIVSHPIITSFRENPIFLGREAMTIPIGSMVDRPIAPQLGMIRINTDL